MRFSYCNVNSICLLGKFMNKTWREKKELFGWRWTIVSWLLWIEIFRRKCSPIDLKANENCKICSHCRRKRKKRVNSFIFVLLQQTRFLFTKKSTQNQWERKALFRSLAMKGRCCSFSLFDDVCWALEHRPQWIRFGENLQTMSRFVHDLVNHACTLRLPHFINSCHWDCFRSWVCAWYSTSVFQSSKPRLPWRCRSSWGLRILLEVYSAIASSTNHFGRSLCLRCMHLSFTMFWYTDDFNVHRSLVYWSNFWSRTGKKR